MDSTQRARFNANFTEEKYAALLRAVNETQVWPADFRISETPIFLTPEFTEEITTAARGIVAEVQKTGISGAGPRCHSSTAGRA